MDRLRDKVAIVTALKVSARASLGDWLRKAPRS